MLSKSKRSIVRYLSSLAVATALLGCASVGQDFPIAEAESFQVGVTTYQEATAKLGKPKAIQKGQNGNYIAEWHYFEKTVLSDVKSKMLNVLFDRDNKMVRIISNRVTE